MTLISVRLEDHLECTSKFNTWKERVLNILEENNLDSYVSIVEEDPTTNEGRINFKKNQEKAKRIIFDSIKDYLMSMIILLKTAKECFNTLTNIFKKKALIQEEGRVQRNFVYTKEENIVLMVRMKKWRNHFTTKKVFHSS